jgi:transcriptional regulator with XRE-family HTH domain
MATNQATPLAEHIGARLRQLREQLGARQEDVAREARRYGLTWSRATVATIELGRRQLSVGEFLLLPLVLNTLRLDSKHWLTPADLLPASGSAPVHIAGGATAPAEVLTALLDGRLKDYPVDTVATPQLTSAAVVARDFGRGAILRHLTRRISEAARPRVLEDAAKDAAGDSEQKIARRLRVAPFALALAARVAWHRSLTEERDRRLQGGKSVSGPAPRGRRGHVTRALLKELRPLLPKTRGGPR